MGRRDKFKEHFKKHVSSWGEALKNAIKKAEVNSRDAEAIPVVPTSYTEILIPQRPIGSLFFGAHVLDVQD